MFVVIMGVSGSGKTTIGRMLAKRLGWPFYDADDFHSPANVAKMTAGMPLTDEDRAGWLESLAELIERRAGAVENGVIACSALKKAYREILARSDRERVKFVYLRGSYEVIAERMKSRGAHFMKPAMLQSQFDILEEPAGVFSVDVSLPPEEIVGKIVEQVVERG